MWSPWTAIRDTSAPAIQKPQESAGMCGGPADNVEPEPDMMFAGRAKSAVFKLRRQPPGVPRVIAARAMAAQLSANGRSSLKGRTDIEERKVENVRAVLATSGGAAKEPVTGEVEPQVSERPASCVSLSDFSQPSTPYPALPDAPASVENRPNRTGLIVFPSFAPPKIGSRQAPMPVVCRTR